ncbi:hypothetical protein TIFTF001_018969 [Ficus carica]|uniref:peroxidase n=1 Tax=Ficus carica TaxID=3494 RepID=A0AA88AF39_FICCA|nr:hypothetical protein TIFTF001_018969 [Ficus carica]
MGIERKRDLVVLSGGHTIETSSCSDISDRLYNFIGKGDTDPTLDSEYIEKLKLARRPKFAS